MFDQLEAKKEALLKKLSETIIEEKMEGITVSVSCTREIKNINISKSMMQEGDKDAIEDVLMATLNRALKNAEDEEMRAMQEMISQSMPSGFGNMEGLSDFLA